MYVWYGLGVLMADDADSLVPHTSSCNEMVILLPIMIARMISGGEVPLLTAGVHYDWYAKYPVVDSWFHFNLLILTCCRLIVVANVFMNMFLFWRHASLTA